MPFKKGQSGNPAGRPKAPNKDELTGALKRVREEKGYDLVDKALLGLADAVEAGEGWAITLLINKKFPSPKPVARAIDIGEPITGTLVEKAQHILDMSTNGMLTIDEGKDLLVGVASMCKINEVTEIEDKLQEYEEDTQRAHKTN